MSKDAVKLLCRRSPSEWKNMKAHMIRKVSEVKQKHRNQSLDIQMQDQIYSNTRVPTQVNTSQHESTRVLHESTRINTGQH